MCLAWILKKSSDFLSYRIFLDGILPEMELFEVFVAMWKVPALSQNIM
jgi:hypothetical protein